MVIYDSIQWQKSQWKLSDLSDKESCIEKFPMLRERFALVEKAFYECGDIPISYEKMVRYVVLVYHKYSPYALYQQDIIARKFDVCEFIGLDTKKSDVKKIIANQVDFVNNAALHFLKLEANMAWLELQTYLDAYYQIMLALVDGKEPAGNKGLVDAAKTKLQVVKEMKTIKSEIDILSNQIFNNDNDLLNHIEKFKEAEKNDLIVLSPEMFAKKKAAA